MDQVKEAKNPAKTVIPKTSKEFSEWLEEHAFYVDLTNEQFIQAAKVRLSFDTLALNKNKPAALAQAQKMHDADMAKLEAMF